MPRIESNIKNIEAEITLPYSKSMSNRILILQHLYPGIACTKHSSSEDTKILREALQHIDATTTFNVSNAGTAMRFLTALFSITPGRRILGGNNRMSERPIGPLVSALKSLGANIRYLNQKGYPPLEITGEELEGGTVTINTSISSQFISALLLIAPTMKRGLNIVFTTDDQVSWPYIQMTLSLLKRIGVECHWKGSKILIEPLKETFQSTIEPERDWSSASYFYAMACLSEKAKIVFKGLPYHSVQGDKGIVGIFSRLGLRTEDKNGDTIVIKNENVIPEELYLDCKAMPDIVQTVAFVTAALKIPTKLFNIQTLQHKETDRIKAMRIELKKMGCITTMQNEGEMIINPKDFHGTEELLNTYEDHRMAMAMAPLSIPFKGENIDSTEVVKKSFPEFWKESEKCGLKVVESTTPISDRKAG